MIVSDIDGTLLERGRPSDGLSELGEAIASHRGQVALVYATGRSFESVWELVEEGILPQPDAIAPLVGTEVWFPDWTRPDPLYEASVRSNWNREACVSVATRIPGLSPQADEFQSPYKASYYVEGTRTVYDIERMLLAEGLEARVVYSCGEYLDILPIVSGKRNAARYLRWVWNVTAENTLTCGDSGNDLDMLCNPRTRNVAVGNAENELLDLADTQPFYKARMPHAAGLLEGARALDFWPSMQPAGASGSSRVA